MVDIDKMMLWGEYIQSERNSQWRERVAEKMTLKGLDLALDPPDINVAPDNSQDHRTVNGIGWKEMAVLGGLGLGGLLGVGALLKPQQPPVQPPAVVSPVVDTDTDTDSSVKLQWGN
jgi:hypothetical protein